jgi:hypothetical protein
MFFGYLKNQTLASGSNFLETKAMRRLVVGPDASLRRWGCGWGCLDHADVPAESRIVHGG